MTRAIFTDGTLAIMMSQHQISENQQQLEQGPPPLLQPPQPPPPPHLLNPPPEYDPRRLFPFGLSPIPEVPSELASEVSSLCGETITEEPEEDEEEDDDDYDTEFCDNESIRYWNSERF